MPAKVSDSVRARSIIGLAKLVDDDHQYAAVMYAPTANGAIAARPARTSAEDQHDEAEGRHGLRQPETAARSVGGGERHRGQLEHQVGHDRADDAADQLRREVDRDLPGGHAAEEPVGQGDHRVEVPAGHRPEREDQRDQSGAGGQRVLQQLEADVVRRQALGGDARADDDGDQPGRAEELGQRLPGEPGQPHGRFTATASRDREASWSSPADSCASRSGTSRW